MGAVTVLGRGKVAVFGDTAMFTAQISGPTSRPAGLNEARAKGNGVLLLNVLHWLAAPEREPKP